MHLALALSCPKLSSAPRMIRPRFGAFPVHQAWTTAVTSTSMVWPNPQAADGRYRRGRDAQRVARGVAPQDVERLFRPLGDDETEHGLRDLGALVDPRRVDDRSEDGP